MVQHDFEVGSGRKHDGGEAQADAGESLWPEEQRCRWASQGFPLFPIGPTWPPAIFSLRGHRARRRCRAHSGAVCLNDMAVGYQKVVAKKVGKQTCVSMRKWEIWKGTSYKPWRILNKKAPKFHPKIAEDF